MRTIGMAKIVPRKDVDRDKWNCFVDEHDLGVWWYRMEWLDYCQAYRGGIDLSFAVLDHDGKILAVFPYRVEGDRFALGGSPILCALIGEIHPMEMPLFQSSVGLMIERQAVSHHIQTSEMMMVPMAREPVAADQFTCDGLVTVDTSFATRVIDLTVPEAQRWSAVRKSYHQLIRRGGERVTVAKPEDYPDPMGTYACLHQGHYGPVRSQATYDLQASWLASGAARPYILLDHGVPVGAVVWYCYKGRAYYASAVYLEDNLAHAAIWESLNDLAANGIRLAEMGWQQRAVGQKAQAIEFFKRGFGGEDWKVQCLKRYFLTDQREGQA